MIIASYDNISKTVELAEIGAQVQTRFSGRLQCSGRSQAGCCSACASKPAVVIAGASVLLMGVAGGGMNDVHGTEQRSGLPNLLEPNYSVGEKQNCNGFSIRRTDPYCLWAAAEENAGRQPEC